MFSGRTFIYYLINNENQKAIKEISLIKLLNSEIKQIPQAGNHFKRKY